MTVLKANIISLSSNTMLLSMLVLIFASGSEDSAATPGSGGNQGSGGANKLVESMPSTTLELYSTAATVAVRRRCQASGHPDARLVLSMLQIVACANHWAQRREYTSADVDEALAGL